MRKRSTDQGQIHHAAGGVLLSVQRWMGVGDVAVGSQWAAAVVASAGSTDGRLPRSRRQSASKTHVRAEATAVCQLQVGVVERRSRARPHAKGERTTWELYPPSSAADIVSPSPPM